MAFKRGIPPLQERIMDVSLKLFAERGYKATTTRMIASKAKVSELTLFRNFGSKEGLLRRSLDRKFDLEGILESIPEGLGKDPRTDLEKMVDMMRANMGKRRDLYRILLREQASNRVVREKLKDLPMTMKAILIGSMEKVLGGRVRKEIDLETATVFFISYFLRSEIMSAMLGEDTFHPIDDERTSQVIDMFLRGVLEGME